MFDTDQFIADIRSTLSDSSRQSTRAVVERAVADPASLMHRLGEPTKAGIFVLHQAADLTIVNLAWGPRHMTLPHDHQLWSVIGIYAGREDNMYWRRLKDPTGRQIDLAGGRALGAGDVEVLGRDLIHSVVNPLASLSCAIHVYGGDLFSVKRSQWDAETLVEELYDTEKANQAFREANELLARR